MSFEGPVTKRELKKKMTAFAKRDPQGYVQAVQNLKAFGDEVATLEGISVGLDDIAPDYKRRDPVLKDALKRIKAAPTDAEKRTILLETQDLMVKATQNHPSDMTIMAKSGGRGSIAQMMKIVASPVVAMDKGQVTPWLVTKSYSQGINPADAWVTGVESRRNAIASSGSVVEPGMVSKVVMNNMDDLVITTEDCGARGGILLKITDQVQDRYLARDEGGIRRNTLVTSAVVARLKAKKTRRILVRSATACEAQDGVCQKCIGLNEWGKPHQVGTNVGARSAQAMTEPLTQFALNAKHGVRLAGGGGSKEPAGLTGFRTLTEVPKSFMDQAAISEHDGRVDSVKRAPQGGWHLEVAGKQYYSPPGLKPIVKEGATVEAGDALSDGVVMPNAVVRHKGVGAGRVYLSNQLTDLYRRQGVDIDRRHTELLARNAMRHVRVEDDPTNKFMRGDVVPYAAVQKTLGKHAVGSPVSKARGKYLAEQTLHYSAGTRLTPSMQADLKKNGVSSVQVSGMPTVFSPIMKSMVQAPLLNDDWMSRLSHRYLKRTLVEGAGFGHETDLSSTSPVPAYVVGGAFGSGHQGKYASEDVGLEKMAGKSGLLRKMLLGSGDALTESVAKKGPDALKLVSEAPWTAGGVDTAALDAMRRMKRLPENFMSDAGLIQNNTLTDDGARFIRELDASEGAFGKSKIRDAFPEMPTRGAEEGAADFTARVQKFTADSEAGQGAYQDLHKRLSDIHPEAARQFTPDVARQYANQRPGGLTRFGRGVGDIMVGQNPLKIMKQRAQMGGLMGRGGLLHGEMAIDPDVMRAWRAAKDPNNPAGYGGLALPVTMDALNKGMAYAMPAGMMYEAAKAPEVEGQSKMENIGGTLGDALGWAVGSPFGMLSGGAFAAPFTAAGKAIGRTVDPNYKDPGAAPRPSAAAPAPAQGQQQGGPQHSQWQQQAAQLGDQSADSVWNAMQSHKYLARLNMAGDAAGAAQNTISQYGPELQRAVQDRFKDAPPPRPPLRQQMKKDFSVNAGHYPAREYMRMQQRPSGTSAGFASPYRNQ
jgi:hypothetical protein